MQDSKPPEGTKKRRVVPRSTTSSHIARVLDWPAVHVVALVAIVVTLGIIWDVIYHTSYATSKFDLRPRVIGQTWYFADKRNVLNQYLVKWATAWTVFGVLVPQVIFSPSRLHSRYFPTRAHRVIELATYMILWYAVTVWMTSYVRTYTGAICQLPLPPKLANNPEFQDRSWIDDMPVIRAYATGNVQPDKAFLSVPYEYCSRPRPINPTLFPELFSMLKPKTRELAREGLYRPESIETSDIKARLFDGFDLSGHIFLLAFSMAVTLRQLAPALRSLYHRGSLVDSPSRQISASRLALYALSVAIGLLLMAVWSFMLWTTSAYFHTTGEKVAGFLVGVACTLTLHLVSKVATIMYP